MSFHFFLIFHILKFFPKCSQTLYKMQAQQTKQPLIRRRWKISGRQKRQDKQVEGSDCKQIIDVAADKITPWSDRLSTLTALPSPLAVCPCFWPTPTSCFLASKSSPEKEFSVEIDVIFEANESSKGKIMGWLLAMMRVLGLARSESL